MAPSAASVSECSPGSPKKTAGEFFRAVDAVLAEPAGLAELTGLAEPAPSGPAGVAPAVFTRPPSPSSSALAGRTGVPAQLAGVVVGAAIALLGVWIGAHLRGRRR